MSETRASGILVCFAIAAVSCSQNSSGDRNEVTKPDRVQNSGLNLTYNERFAELVDEIKMDKAGNIWVGYSAKNGPEAPITSTIEKRDSQGNPANTVIELGEAILSGFTVYDDGKIVAAVYTDGEAIGSDYALKLVKVAADGKIVDERKFEDYTFQEPADFKCSFSETKHGFWGTDSVRLGKVGENVVLLTYNCFYSRLSLLDTALNPIWSKEINVERSDNGSFYGSGRLFVTSDGTIITADRINAADVALFNRYFHENHVGIGESDILLNAYDVAGHKLYSGIVGTLNDDLAAGIVSNGDAIFVAADIKVERPTSVRDFQRDIWLSAFDTKLKKTIWAKEIDIRNEDSVESLALINGLYLALGGSTDWLQVPTRSIVKHGDAFILLADLDGVVKGKKVFGTSRHDNVASIVDLGSERLLAGGSKDGPITHDGDSDKSQLHRFGFVDAFSLTDLLTSIEDGAIGQRAMIDVSNVATARSAMPSKQPSRR